MFSMIPDVGFSSFFLFHALFSQIIFEENLLNSIMRDMPAIFMFDYCLRRLAP